MRVLGIETSCDETAAAVVEDGTKLLGNVIVSQIDIHKEFGGVVPEVAARSHIEAILPTIEKALRDAFSGDDNRESRDSKNKPSQNTDYSIQTSQSDLWDQIDAIAVTHGPGLSGSLLIGALTARTLALLKNKPLYPINHVEGHTYANFITEVSSNTQHATRNMGSKNKLQKTDRDNFLEVKKEDLPKEEPEFPLLSLTVSGGHSQLVLFHDHGQYELLGQTRDDAAGEAFDKVAKLLGLGYPGGPAIAQAAKKGDPHAYDFPTAKLANPYDFSFSGLKTAVLRHLQRLIGEEASFPSFEIAPHLSEQQVNDTAASFQRVIVETMVNKTVHAHDKHSPKTVVIAGGVAANQTLRDYLAEALPVDIEYAPMELCTDNAAMIAARGYFTARYSQSIDPLSLNIEPSLPM